MDYANIFKPGVPCFLNAFVCEVRVCVRVYVSAPKANYVK